MSVGLTALVAIEAGAILASSEMWIGVASGLLFVVYLSVNNTCSTL